MAFSSKGRPVSAPAAGTVPGAPLVCAPWAPEAVVVLTHIHRIAAANGTIGLFVMSFMVNPLLETIRNKK
jgi:hypothetical protein